LRPNINIKLSKPQNNAPNKPKPTEAKVKTNWEGINEILQQQRVSLASKDAPLKGKCSHPNHRCIGITDKQLNPFSQANLAPTQA